MGMNPSAMTLQGSNTYLVGSGKERILIDTGEGHADYLANLTSAMKSVGCEKISMVILTHHHHDHVGGIGDIVAKFPNVDTKSIYKMSQEEEGEEDAEAKLVALAGIKPTKSTSSDQKQPPDSDSKSDRPQQLPMNYQGITDGMKFRTDGAVLQAVATPGHTSDHVSLLLVEEQALFSGDCVLGQGTTVVGDLVSYMKSLNRLLGLKPKVVYPGHGPVVEDPSKHIQHYIDHRNKRESQIINVLADLKKKHDQNEAKNTGDSAVGSSGGGGGDQVGCSEGSSGTHTGGHAAVWLSSMEIVKIIYVNTPVKLHLAAEMNVIQHLRKLKAEGKVVSTFAVARQNKYAPDSSQPRAQQQGNSSSIKNGNVATAHHQHDRATHTSTSASTSTQSTSNKVVWALATNAAAL